MKLRRRYGKARSYKPLKDTRASCPHCGVKTWSRDFVGFMRDHDRPDGKVCRAAQADYPKKAEWKPEW